MSKEAYKLTLVALDGWHTKPDLRLRALLKRALRDWGLKCVQCAPAADTGCLAAPDDVHQRTITATNQRALAPTLPLAGALMVLATVLVHASQQGLPEPLVEYVVAPINAGVMAVSGAVSSLTLDCSATSEALDPAGSPAYLAPAGAGPEPGLVAKLCDPTPPGEKQNLPPQSNYCKKAHFLKGQVGVISEHIMALSGVAGVPQISKGKLLGVPKKSCRAILKVGGAHV